MSMCKVKVVACFEPKELSRNATARSLSFVDFLDIFSSFNFGYMDHN